MIPFSRSLLRCSGRHVWPQECHQCYQRSVSTSFARVAAPLPPTSHSPGRPLKPLTRRAKPRPGCEALTAGFTSPAGDLLVPLASSELKTTLEEKGAPPVPLKYGCRPGRVNCIASIALIEVRSESNELSDRDATGISANDVRAPGESVISKSASKTIVLLLEDGLQSKNDGDERAAPTKVGKQDAGHTKKNYR